MRVLGKESRRLAVGHLSGLDTRKGIEGFQDLKVPAARAASFLRELEKLLVTGNLSCFLMVAGLKRFQYENVSASSQAGRKSSFYPGPTLGKKNNQMKKAFRSKVGPIRSSHCGLEASPLTRMDDKQKEGQADEKKLARCGKTQTSVGSLSKNESESQNNHNGIEGE